MSDFQNEFQAAYHLSQIEQISHRVFIPEGKFAVVEECPDYCIFTDAMLPNPARNIVSLHNTRAEAEAAAAARIRGYGDAEDGSGDFGEVDVVVLPREVRAPVPYDYSDEVPF